MNLFQRFLSFFLLFIIPLNILCQQSKVIYFDELWQISASKYSKFYKCDCYVLESGAFDGPFNCYTIKSDVKVKTLSFVNNVLDGEMYEYYEDGSVKLHAFYKKGTPVEEWKEWNREGNLVVDKTFDDNSKILKDKKKQLSEYEKMYFGTKEFEPPVYSTDCILKTFDSQKNKCSDEAMLEYYKHPPLPPSYLNNASLSGKTVIVKLKYQISEDGKVIDFKIIETSGDVYLDDLAGTHVLNMIPFESAKNFENPIRHWIEAEIQFIF